METKLDNIDSPIFIIGAPRSGTTLTAKILNLHSNIFMPGETHFFDDIYSRRNILGNPSDEIARQNIIDRLSDIYNRYYESTDQKRIDSLIKNGKLKQKLFKYGTSYEKLFSYFMLVQMQKENKSRWGNNVPRDIFNIEIIMRYYPNAKIIVCLRDVRAFLLSYKGKWRVTSEEHKKRIQKLYHPIVTTMLWKASMKKLNKVKQLVPQENLLIIQYESLVSEPKNVVSNMCKIIGERFEPQMLDIDTNNSSSPITGAGIFITSLEKWKTELKPEEIEIAQLLTKSEMKNFGYATYKTNANILKVFICILSTPWSLLRSLQTNKDMYGNVIPYLLKRILSLLN